MNEAFEIIEEKNQLKQLLKTAIYRIEDLLMDSDNLQAEKEARKFLQSNEIVKFMNPEQDAIAFIEANENKTIDEICKLLHNKGFTKNEISKFLTAYAMKG